MDRLQELLAAENVQVQKLQERVAAMGYNPDELTDDDAMAIAVKLIEEAQNKLAAPPKQASKITSQKTGSRATRTERTPKADNGLNTAVKKVAKEVSTDIDAYRNAIISHRDQWVEVQSEKLVDELMETPNLLVQKIGQKAEEVQGNADFFRQEGERVGAAIFSFE